MTPPDPQPKNDLYTALAADLGLAPQAAPPAEPEPAPPAAEPEPQADPVKELEQAAPEPELTGLPIDELNEAPDPEPEPPKDKVAYTLKQLKEQVKTLKGETAAERAAKAQLETKVADLEARAKEADELRQKLEEYDNEMLAVRIEKSREYQEAVKKPTDNIVSKLEKLSGKHSLDYDKLTDILETEDDDEATDKLNALVSGLDVPVTDIVAITKLRGDYLPIKAKQAELYAKADKVLLELEARGKQQDEAAVAAAAEERRRVFPTVVSKVANSIPELKAIIESVSGNVIETDTTKLDVATQGYNHLAGLALPKLVSTLRKLQKDHDGLIEELATYRKADTAPGQFTRQGGHADPPKDFLDALQRSGLGQG